MPRETFPSLSEYPVEDAMSEIPGSFASVREFAAYTTDPRHIIRGVTFLSPKDRFTLENGWEVFATTETDFSIIWFAIPPDSMNDSRGWRCIKFLNPDQINISGTRASSRFEREIGALQRYQDIPPWLRVSGVAYEAHPFAEELDQPEILYPLLVTHFCNPPLTMETLCTSIAFRRLRRYPPFIAAFGINAALALKGPQREGRAHRDTSLQNAFFTPHGTSAFTFFDTGIITDPDHRLTETGILLGTAGIMSPEQIKSPWALDYRSDIYALGCCLFRLAARHGEYPFGSTTDVERAAPILLRHLNVEPPFEDIADTDPRLADVIRQCLRKRRDRRPQSLEDIVQQLIPIVRGTGAEQLVPQEILSMSDFMDVELDELFTS